MITAGGWVLGRSAATPLVGVLLVVAAALSWRPATS
jgi:hypothetical protein